MTDIILFILLNVCDCLTTYKGLNMGLFEANIFLRGIFAKNIYAGLAVKMGLVIAVVILLALIKKLHLLPILNIAFAIIVIWNLSLIITR